MIQQSDFADSGMSMRLMNLYMRPIRQNGRALGRSMPYQCAALIQSSLYLGSVLPNSPEKTGALLREMMSLIRIFQVLFPQIEAICIFMPLSYLQEPNSLRTLNM